jgi:lipopolysaccharide export LptBFGC system permease protein LptF
MTRPGNWLLAMTARWCSDTTMARVIEPGLADLQSEYQNAISCGRVWKSRWIRIAGYVVFLRVIVLCGWEGTMQSLRGWSVDDRRILIRTIGVSIAAITIVTVVLEVPTLRLLRTPRYQMHHGDLGLLFVYLIPQGLGLAIPIGCMVGILYGIRARAVSRRSAAAVLAFVIVASLFEFATMAWMLPAGNQAFRAVLSMPDNPAPRRGVNEFTLGELSQQINSARETPSESEPVRELAFAYHQRWAFSFATVMLALFAVSMSYQRSTGRASLFIFAAVGLFGYYVLLFFGRAAALLGMVPGFAGAWLPNVVCLLLSAVLLNITWRRSQLPI